MQCPVNKSDHTSRSRARTWRVSNNLAWMRNKYPSAILKNDRSCYLSVLLFLLY